MKNVTLSIGMLVFGPGLAAVVACSADYGPVATRTSRPPPAATEAPAPSASGSAAPPSSTWPDAGHTGGGPVGNPSPAGDDAGSEGGSGGGDGTFLGEATAYASAPVVTSARSLHQSGSQPQQTPTMDCQVCHGAGGIAPTFLAAGFVATQPGGTNGASDVEVRVWSATDSAGASAHTDADGFFWIPAGGTTVTAPFKAGARDATHTMLMPTQPPGGACSGASCHGGSPGAIHVP
jgi:hypothetical protein